MGGGSQPAYKLTLEYIYSENLSVPPQLGGAREGYRPQKRVAMSSG